MKQLVKFISQTLEGFAVLDHRQTEKVFKAVELFMELFPEEELEVSPDLLFSDYRSFRNSFEIINISRDEAETFEEYFCTSTDPFPHFGLVEVFDLQFYQQIILETFLELYFDQPINLVALKDAVEKLKAAHKQGVVTEELVNIIEQELKTL